jgi:hypothetical protein
VIELGDGRLLGGWRGAHVQDVRGDGSDSLCTHDVWSPLNQELPARQVPARRRARRAALRLQPPAPARDHARSQATRQSVCLANRSVSRAPCRART